MSSTKKIPSSLNKNGELGKGSEFVIPLDGGSGFYGIKTGRRHELAAITFVGTSVSAEDILDKMNSVENRNNVLEQLEKFIVDLQTYKIGNVISVAYSETGFELSFHATRPSSANKPLP